MGARKSPPKGPPDPSSKKVPRWRLSTASSKSARMSACGVGTKGGDDTAIAIRLGDAASSATTPDRSCWNLHERGREANKRERMATGSSSSRKRRKLRAAQRASKTRSRIVVRRHSRIRSLVFRWCAGRRERVSAEADRRLARYLVSRRRCAAGRRLARVVGGRSARVGARRGRPTARARRAKRARRAFSPGCLATTHAPDRATSIHAHRKRPEKHVLG